MREHTVRATGAIFIATALHAIAVGNMLPAFHTRTTARPAPLMTICVDQTEFVVNKLKDRGTHQAFGVVTNAQDFMHVLRFYVEQGSGRQLTAPSREPAGAAAGRASPRRWLAVLPADEVEGSGCSARSGASAASTAPRSSRRVDGDRRRIYTARYALTIKGKERGEFELQLEEVGSGPVEALERAAGERAPSALDEERRRRCRCPLDQWSRRPHPMAHLSREEAAGLLERFRRYLREHRLPVTPQRDLVARVVFDVRRAPLGRGHRAPAQQMGAAGRHRHRLPHARHAGRERPRPARTISARASGATSRWPRRRQPRAPRLPAVRRACRSSRTSASNGCCPSSPTRLSSSTSGTASRSTASAVTAGSVTWAACSDE